MHFLLHAGSRSANNQSGTCGSCELSGSLWHPVCSLDVRRMQEFMHKSYRRIKSPSLAMVSRPAMPNHAAVFNAEIAAIPVLPNFTALLDGKTDWTASGCDSLISQLTNF